MKNPLFYKAKNTKTVRHESAQTVIFNPKSSIKILKKELRLGSREPDNFARAEVASGERSRKIPFHLSGPR